MDDVIKQILERLLIYNWVWGVVVVALAVVGATVAIRYFIELLGHLETIKLKLKKVRLSSADLKKKIDDVCVEIGQLLADHSANEPHHRLSGDQFDHTDYVTRLVENGRKMIQNYEVRVLPRVIFCREELLKRGINDTEFDRHYTHPTNPIGMGIVVSRLGALGEKL